MTSQNFADLDERWAALSACRHGVPAGTYRSYQPDGSFRLLTCTNSENGQNGQNVTNRVADLYAHVPGQLTIFDAMAASDEDVAAAEVADKLVAAALGGNVTSLMDWLARAGRKPGVSIVEELRDGWLPDSRFTQVADISQFGQPGARKPSTTVVASVLGFRNGTASIMPTFDDTPGTGEKPISECETINAAPCSSATTEEC